MGPASTSKDLLDLEHKELSSSSLESTLFVCKKNSPSQTPKPNTFWGKLVTSSVPKSQVLGKIKDFLGVMAEANTRLQHDAKEKCTMDYDIEVLRGNETEYIEMIFIPPEAVAAAESAMAGSKSVIPLAAACCSGSDTEISDDDDDDDDDNDGDGDGNDKACSSNELKKSTLDKEVVLNNGQAKKRQKIIELL